MFSERLEAICEIVTLSFELKNVILCQAFKELLKMEVGIRVAGW